MTVRFRYRSGNRWKPRMVAQGFFLITGLLAIGYVACVYTARLVHQTEQDWAFERALAQSPKLVPLIKPPQGSAIGRILIPRLGITALIDEGVDPRTLALSVGHIPSTALPGQPGNVGIAGHRDTFFRSLRGIQRDDLITLTTLRGEYRYRVVSTKVVRPQDVGVLHSDGSEVLTLITCYPFYFVGSAPERFIVRAARVLT